VQEQDELEQKQAELFGIRLPQEQMNREIADAASFWLSPQSLRRLVDLYLQRTCGKEQDFILGEKPLKTLRLSQDFRAGLLKDFQLLPRQNSSIYREWEAWLKGGDRHLSVTFESDCAMRNPKATFIMPLHPLVKQAAQSLDSNRRVVTSLQAASNEAPIGRCKFAVYQWRFLGVREDLDFMPIALNQDLTEHLGRLLETAVDCPAPLSGEIDVADWDDLEAQHFKLWDEARTRHRQKTRQLAEYRRESLTASHRARIALLNEQFEQATNERIQKMRRSQIASAEADYSKRIQELDIALERADIIAKPVAYGVIDVLEERS
jgi:hypothetical protein